MAYGFHRFIMGKVKIAIYCFVSADNSKNVSSKMFLEEFSFNHVNFVRTNMTTEKLN